MIYNFNIKFIILLVSLLGIVSLSHAQEPTFAKYGSIDRQVGKLPDSLSNHIIHVHRYLDSIGIDD
jgi:hypothetical protein